ncbi:MAG: glycosyltransferase [Bacteroidia bacterium]|nr:glycosyltransferase [Bacteroidia bacterium]
MTIYFLIPVYNESENIYLLSENLKNVLTEENKYYVFVDDFSSDNTIELLKKYFDCAAYHIIQKNKNIGPGDSFNKGFDWILKHSNNQNNLVVTLEGDNTSDLLILPNMITISKLGYDLVLASVYAQGGGFTKTTFLRIFISFIANMFFRLFFNIKVQTLSSFYRVYHIDLLIKIKSRWPEIIKENGFICMLEILIKAIKSDANIIEVPMILKSDRRKGKSKMKIIKTIFSYFRYLFFSRR